MSGKYFKTAGNLDGGYANENVANGITDTTVNTVGGGKILRFLRS